MDLFDMVNKSLQDYFLIRDKLHNKLKSLNRGYKDFSLAIGAKENYGHHFFKIINNPCVDSFLDALYVLGFEFRIEDVALDCKKKLLYWIESMPQALNQSKEQTYGDPIKVNTVLRWSKGVEPKICNVLDIIDSIGAEWSVIEVG